MASVTTIIEHARTGDANPLASRTGLRVALGVTAIIALVAAVGLGLNEGDSGRRLSHAWLLNGWFTITICLGGLFFVAIQHLVRAGWSVTLRRVAELLGASVFVPLILLLPVFGLLFFGSDGLYPWNDAELVASDKILEGKAPFLNAPFFAARAALYAAVWIASAFWLLRTSRRQDQTHDKQLTARMEGRSAPILIGLALTITFASFDWIMSLDPYWFSTIFGIYAFSGAFVGALAVISIIAALLVLNGSQIVTREHLHDVAKLLFGMNCFWAYIAFSQYLLIWYANIPEETVWLKHRNAEGWATITQALTFGHFIIPFVLLMPRIAKRNPIVVIAVSVLLLVMHWVDLYWLTYPQLAKAPVFGLVEILAVVGFVSATGFAFIRLSAQSSLFPIHDPRLEESVGHEVH